jgi:hypothetical protein
MLAGHDMKTCSAISFKVGLSQRHRDVKPPPLACAAVLLPTDDAASV